MTRRLDAKIFHTDKESGKRVANWRHGAMQLYWLVEYFEMRLVRTLDWVKQTETVYLRDEIDDVSFFFNRDDVSLQVYPFVKV
jgi:hypothetical protein